MNLSPMAKYVQYEYQQGNMTQQDIQSLVPFMISQNDFNLIFNTQTPNN